MRAGNWNKVSKGCYEVRGRVLGIVGYGHIGSQLSVLAESMGMKVIYHYVLPLMPLGSALQADSLEDLLGRADFVSLHVPDLPETRGMIGKRELAAMKPGAYLINNARGSVVDIFALVDALKSKHLAGCAIDVFPKEPAKNGVDNFNDELNAWASELRKLDNVILTPHIGGSTEEAQRMIGVEVGNALCRYINYGGRYVVCSLSRIHSAVSARSTSLKSTCAPSRSKRRARCVCATCTRTSRVHCAR